MVLPVVAGAVARVGVRAIGKQIAKKGAQATARVVGKEAAQAGESKLINSASNYAGNRVENAVRNKLQGDNDNIPQATNKRRPSDGGDLRAPQADNDNEEEKIKGFTNDPVRNDNDLSPEAAANLPQNIRETLTNPNRVKENEEEELEETEYERRTFEPEYEVGEDFDEDEQEDDDDESEEEEDGDEEGEGKDDKTKFPTALFTFSIVEYIIRAFLSLSGAIIMVMGAGFTITVVGAPVGAILSVMGVMLFAWVRLQAAVASGIVGFWMTAADLSKVALGSNRLAKYISASRWGARGVVLVVNQIPIVSDVLPTLPLLIWRSYK